MSRAVDVGSALHVLTLTPFFPSDQNEVSGCFVAEPIEQLKQFGVDSSVIAVSPIYHPRKQSSSSAAADWVRYPQVPGTLGLSSAGKLLYARLLGRIRQLHSVKPIDVIHAHAALPCGHAAALLSRRLNIPFVVTVHGLDVFNTCSLGGIPAAWRRKVSVDVYRAARTVICISGKVQEILKAGTPACSAIVYNGANPTLFSPNPNEIGPFDPEILVVGNLLRSKGHELVLRALGNLRLSFPRLRCRIIGEGPDRHAIGGAGARFRDWAASSVCRTAEPVRSSRGHATLLRIRIAQPERGLGMRIPRSDVLRQTGRCLSRTGN